MSKPGEPFDGSDFEEPCEDCFAPAGALCYAHCPSGYSALTREKHVRLIQQGRVPVTELEGNRQE